MKKERPQCGLLLENEEGLVLLQLRDNNPAIPFPNCWGTFGGQIEEGESPEQAIIREIREELDYIVEEPDCYCVYSYDGYEIYMFRKMDQDLLIENLDVREGQGAQFFSREMLKTVECAFNCREIVEDYFRRFSSVK